MTSNPNAELDRVIDEALASAVTGEPSRVNALSVRRGIEQSRSPRLPVWLAIAAVLAVAFGVSFRKGETIEEAPKLAQRSEDVRIPPEPLAIQWSEPNRARGIRFSKRTTSHMNETALDDAYEGLPRLVVSPLDLPEPLFTPDLEANALQIPGLEITPLRVSIPSVEPQK